MSRCRYQLLNVKERLRRPRTGPRGPFRKRWSQPAYKPGSVRPATLAGGRRDGHSSGTAVTGRLEQPTRMAGPEDGPEPLRAPPPLFGFAPGGACHAVAVAGSAVRSYRTLSPLPRKRGGLLSVALSLGSPPPDVIRRRVSMEPGLSSARTRRPSGRLAASGYGDRGARSTRPRASVAQSHGQNGLSQEGLA